VSVNGVCLTVTDVVDGAMQADIGAETARVTTLGRLRPGSPVNLERAMRADSRFGGHFVQGHVDGTSAIERVRRDGDTTWIRIGVPPALAPLMVRKGSIAVDGISLTIADLTDAWFEVMIIPFTWTHTHLASIQVDDLVNLECDMVGKYVIRAVEAYGGAATARAATQGSAT
jgi:riboflavin synthase